MNVPEVIKVTNTHRNDIRYYIKTDMHKYSEPIYKFTYRTDLSTGERLIINEFLSDYILMTLNNIEMKYNQSTITYLDLTSPEMCCLLF